MNEYDKMANDFAAKTGTRLTVLDMDYKPMWGEERSRCVFTCRLSRGKHAYTFEFGQSLAMGAAEPDMYDVLACLQKYDVGSFPDFCEEFGYAYGPKARKIYDAVVRECNAVQRLFGDVMDELRDIN